MIVKCFLAWAAAKEKLPPKRAFLLRWPPKERFQRRLASGVEEMIDHLFVYCQWVPWHLSLSLMGVSWVHHHAIRDVLVSRRGRSKKSRILRVWKLIPLAICGALVNGGITIIFEGKASTIQDFKPFS